MSTVRVHDLLPMRALITRESARLIGEALTRALAEASGEVEIDFAGIDAVTPSFVDEILSIVDEATGELHNRSISVIFANAPTRLSAKFSAVGRGHGRNIDESSAGRWVITGNAQPTGA